LNFFDFFENSGEDPSQAQDDTGVAQDGAGLVQGDRIGSG